MVGLLEIMQTRVSLWTSICLAVMLAAGCGSGEIKRYNVAGSVTYGGAPVPAGTISFEPVGKDIAPGFATIKNGKYDTTENGVGQIGGAHVVKITGDSRLPVDPNSFQADSYVAKELFPKFQTDAELPKRSSTQDFDVPKSAKKK